MKPEDIRYLKLKYSFETSTGAGFFEEYDFYNQYTVDIYGCNLPDNEDQEEEVLIGKAVVYQFLLGYLIDREFPLEDFLSCFEAGRYLGDIILDGNTGIIKQEYEELLGGNGNFNILYLDCVMLFPEYRGYGYGKFIIKDIICRFYSTAGLILTIVFPLQSAPGDSPPEMNDHQMDQDLEYSSYKLYRYFLSLGFEQVNRSNFFIIDPCKVNERLDNIDLGMQFEAEYYTNREAGRNIAQSQAENNC